MNVSTADGPHDVATPRATGQRRGVASVCAWLRSHGLGERTLKTAVAVTLAWAVGAHVPGGTAHPYFAPLAALLSLQITVAESISGAVQRVVGIVAGVAVALAVSRLVGETAWGIGLLVLLSLVVGANLRLSAQGVAQVGISALLVLFLGGASSLSYAGSRIVDSVVGALIGVGVNALLVPPSQLPAARAAQRALGVAVAQALENLAAAVAAGLTRESALGSVREAHALRVPLTAAQEALTQADTSLKYHLHGGTQQARLVRCQQGVDVLEHAVLQVRELARTMADLVGDTRASAPEPEWLAPSALGSALADLLSGLALAVSAVTDLADEVPGAASARAQALATIAQRRRVVARTARRQAPALTVESWMRLGALLAVADRMRADLAAAGTARAPE